MVKMLQQTEKRVVGLFFAILIGTVAVSLSLVTVSAANYVLTVNVQQSDGLGTPVSGATVWVYPEGIGWASAGYPGGVVAQGTTDGGSVQFTLDTAKKYWLWYFMAGQPGAGGMYPGWAQLFQFAGAATVTVHLTKVSFYVKQHTASGDQWLSSAKVEVYRSGVGGPGQGSPTATGTTDNNGKAWFGSYDGVWLPDSSWSAGGGWWSWATKTSCMFGHRTNFDVGGSPPTTSVTHYLSQFKIKVKVQGSLKPGITVLVYSSDIGNPGQGWYTLSGTTDSNGQYSFWTRDGTAGSYQFYFLVGSGTIPSQPWGTWTGLWFLVGHPWGAPGPTGGYFAVPATLSITVNIGATWTTP